MRVTQRLVDGRIETIRFAEPGDVQVDAVLTGVSIGYNPAGHIADIVFPRVMAQRETVKIPVFGHEVKDIGGNPIMRADKTKRARGSWDITWVEKTLAEYAFEVPVGDRERSNAEPVVNVENAAAKLAKTMLMQDKEYRVATLLTTLGNHASTNRTTLTGDDQWSSPNTSDPVDDINTGKEAIGDGVFTEPNTLVLGGLVFNTLRTHPKLLEFFKYTRGGLVTPQMMAEAFQVERVLVANARYRTSNPGQSTVTSARIWGKHAVLLYVPPSPALEEPAAGYQIVYQDVQAIRYRDNEAGQDIIGNAEISGAFITHTGAAYLIKDAIA